MPNETPKAHEIKRLTSPLTFKNSKAYDIEGNKVNCVEALSEIKYIMEPKAGLLSDDEVLRYAYDSKYASKIKFKRGHGSFTDLLIIHESLPWMLGIYYVVLFCIFIPFMYWGNKMAMFLILILAILPLLYIYYELNMKDYSKPEKAFPKKTVKDVNIKDSLKSHDAPIGTDASLQSLKKYEKEVNNLKVLFDVKEGVVKELIEKRFEPPQITYDKFISIIDSAHKLFYSQYDAALNIINLAAEDTPRIEGELEHKIGNMKTIIDQIEELTNELVINISSEDSSSEEVKDLIDEMENLIGSVKKY